jgi:hypothetical protein
MNGRTSCIKLAAIALAALPGAAGSVVVTTVARPAEAAPSRPDWCGSYKPGDDN